MVGLAILKHMHNLSDEAWCDRWIENPYFQFFCGEEFFHHKLPFDRSSMTHWRQRMGEGRLVALSQESLSVATKTGAAKPSDFSKVIIDATVQPKALEVVIPDMERQIGASVARIVADRGYRGHNAPPGLQFKVFISGQKRRVTEQIKRELRRRPAVEPVIGHLKSDHRMDRNHLAHAAGDAINAVLAAAGYNFRRLLAWLALLLSAICAAIFAARNMSEGAVAA